MAILISLVRLTASSPATGRVPTFLGVTGLALMADHAHDVGLTTLSVDGVAHRLAVDGEAVIGLPIGRVPALQRPAKWVCFHLYVILDVFSRYVVGWMIAPRESAELAHELIAATCDKEGIARGQLTLHADRGTSMRSKPVALLLADLGVTRSHSRPHVSDDNPYSEAQFKTLKYQPDFPACFESIEHARAFCQGFFAWYNHAHRHSGIGYMTPAAVHTGQAPRLYAVRQQVLDQAFVAHPERFTRRHPTPPALPVEVGINLPKPTPRVPGEAQRSTLNSPQPMSQSC
jgi:putative transposase